MTDTDVQVTQADREAAAGFFSPGAPEAACLAGQFDDRPIVQALAHHRTQSIAKLEADNAALRAENEDLRELLGNLHGSLVLAFNYKPT